MIVTYIALATIAAGAAVLWVPWWLLSDLGERGAGPRAATVRADGHRTRY